MNKKWVSILLAGALSITVTSMAFASDGEQSGGSSSRSKSEHRQSSSERPGSHLEKNDNNSMGSSKQDDNGVYNHNKNMTNSDTKHFSDMGEAMWAAPYVMKLEGRNVLSGYPDGSFKPNQAVNRVECITMMARSQNAPQGTGQTLYVDAPSWACDYVNWAVEKNILIPDEDKNKLQSEKPATRLWVAQMAVRALGLDAQATVAQNTYLPFNDSAAVPDDMAGYVKLATEKGIFVGYPDCTFQPNKPITRAEMSIIMNRLDAVLNNETLGTVTAVDAGSITLSVNGGSGKTLSVSPSATVVINNSTATLNNIQAGDVVEITLDTAGKAVIIDATRSQPAPAPAPAP